MRWLLTFGLVCWMAMALAGCGGGGGAGPDGIAEGAQEGQRLPDAEFTTFANEKVTIHSLRGQPVILNFWATWCGPCREEIPLLQQAFQEHAGAGLRLLAVTDEQQGEVRAFMQNTDMAFPVLFDQGGRAGRNYRVQGIPTTFFLNREGIIVARQVGALTPGLLAVYVEEILQPVVGATPGPADASPTPASPPTPTPVVPVTPLPTPLRQDIGLARLPWFA